VTSRLMRPNHRFKAFMLIRASELKPEA
jgi:hypothetical protein